MLATYKAILKGNQLEWEEEPPTSTENGTPMPVHVTFLTGTNKASGKKLAAILEELATLNAFTDIADPVAWQREVRAFSLR